MRAAVSLVWAEIHPVLFLAQIVGRIDVAKQRQLLAVLLCPCREFRDLFEQYVLMAHHHHGNIPAEQFSDLFGTITCGIDHIFAPDFALGGLYHPLVAVTPHAAHRAKANDLCAQLAGALRQRLGKLCRIDVAVIRIVKRPGEIVGLQERVARFDLIRPDDIDRHALVAAHALGALEFAHTLLAMGQPHRTGDVVIDRIVDFAPQDRDRARPNSVACS